MVLGLRIPDHDFGFDSFMLAKDELADYGYSESEYLLATDTAVVVPVGKTVVMQVTGADVIHSWTIPAFGVKQDAVPGRLARALVRRREGRHLFRPVFRTVRQGPRLYADHRQGGERREYDSGSTRRERRICRRSFDLPNADLASP